MRGTNCARAAAASDFQSGAIRGRLDSSINGADGANPKFIGEKKRKKDVR